MLDMIATLKDPTKVTDEQVTQAYETLKEYCDANDMTVLELVNNDDNIRPAAEEIHSQLPWVVRKTVKVDRIENMIVENIDFIRQKAKEQVALEKKAKKTKKTK